jgi:CubicO group peptidase (beta-lactamase class C family)
MVPTSRPGKSLSIGRIAAAALAVIVLGAAVYGGATWRYWRNYLRQDDSLDRVASADKYSPTEKVEGAPGAPIPMATGGGDIDPAALADARAQARASGTMALLIYAHGKLQAADYAPGFSADSFFDSYSSHKGLLAVAVLAAIDHGFLRLSDPASTYIPAWGQDERRAITVGDLLWMQSGLIYPKWKKAPFNPVLEFFVGTNLPSAVAKAKALEPPGREFDFNHIDSQALHDVLVGATHQRYADFLSRYVWKPLGAGPAYVALDHPGGAARTVCCFINTAPNWLRLGVMLAERGQIDGHRVLSPEAVKLLSRPAPLNPGFGMNVWLARQGPKGRLASQVRHLYTLQKGRFLADDLYYIEGHGGQRLYVVPSRDLVIYRTGRVNYAWDDVTFANAIIAGLDKGRPVNPGESRP